MKIIVSLPADREQIGQLSLWGDETPDPASTTLIPAPLLFSCPCLGRSDNTFAAAHGNPTRNPMLPGGDTPLGGYLAHVVYWASLPGHPDESEEYAYGPLGYMTLAPISGPALLAAKVRSGLLVHAGAPNPTGPYLHWLGMRPTHGCIRMRNFDQAALFKLLPTNKAISLAVVQAPVAQAPTPPAS